MIKWSWTSSFSIKNSLSRWLSHQESPRSPIRGKILGVRGQGVDLDDVDGDLVLERRGRRQDHLNVTERLQKCFGTVVDSGLLGSGEVPRGEKMLYSGTDPESYIAEYTLVYEEKVDISSPRACHTAGYEGILTDFRVLSIRKSVALSVGTPYVPTVLPTVESMDHLLPGYSRSPFEVRCAEGTL